jgi:hypothetical protein
LNNLNPTKESDMTQTQSQANHATQPVGGTILVVMMDVDEADDAVFNKWYDEEHLPERMSIPGYISARRFKLEPGDELNRGGVLRYLCIWEMEDDSPLKSQIYNDQNANPTPTKEAANAVVKQRARGLYRQITPAVGGFTDKTGYTYPDGRRFAAN